MDINAIIEQYNAMKEQEKQAKKEKERLAILIKQFASGTGYIETEGYNVIIDTRESVRIDTESLYKDFPDLKDVYGRTTKSEVITVKEKKQIAKIA